MTSQEALQKRANAWSEMQNLMSSAEGRSMTAEEQERFDKFEAEIESLTEESTRAAKFEQHKSDYAEVRVEPTSIEKATAGPSKESDEARASQAFSAWSRYGINALSTDDRALMQSRFTTLPSEARAQGTGTTAGGYTIPALFRQTLIEAQLAFGSVRSVAEVITTETGASLPWPTVDDTANVGAILAENTAATELDVVFGTASLDVYMYTSKQVRVSLQLLQDSAFDLDNWLPAALGVRIARILNAHFTTGTGTAQPLGISTSATIAKTGLTGQTTTVIYADFIDLIDSLDPAYLTNAQYMMKTAAPLRRLIDGQNRPLWEPSLQVGRPDTFLGYPIVINPDMPAMAANARSILFGDFRAGYVIRDVLGIQQLRLEERYAEYLQVGFLAFQRAGATVQNASAYKAYRNSAT